MAKFRKKPVVIEAVQLEWNNWDEMCTHADVGRLEDGSRRIISIQEVEGMEGDIITLSEIFKYSRQGIDDQGNVQGQFVATGLVPKCLNKLKRMGVDIDTSVFTENLGINRRGL